MASNFKKQMSERKESAPRVAIPQVDPEAPKPTPAEPVALVQPTVAVERVEPEVQASTAVAAGPAPMERPIYLTLVSTEEQPTNRGFAMYPSRHTQVVRDLAFIEGRRPWAIIEDALEEYVIKHYGKQYKRR
ncbi:hypothetical protein ABH920_005690 [Catenulispora sp. EB89]|uniref:hypothetical protein n=1 Tax=Catenulispora sp. EB89 TaxID=3156257 RepID=UPI00351851EA